MNAALREFRVALMLLPRLPAGRIEGAAPNLADAIWLRGSSHDAILRQLKTPRMGVMPPWQARLGEAEVRAVTAYVHGLGGGEATVDAEGAAAD